MSVQPIPEGYEGITPYLIVDGAAEAIAFYTKAFGAEELLRSEMGEDKIGHAELRIGGGLVMLADAVPDMGFQAPGDYGGTPVFLHVYYEDVDAVYERAREAGAEVVREIEDQFYGDRSATLRDPFGHMWTISTHVEDVPEEEIRRRIKEMFDEGENG